MPSRKASILVVDDNEGFCQNATDILEVHGYKVVAAFDGFKALELVKQDGFDLVLMDVRMPAMDGVETFKKFKEVAPDTPIIMVTAYATEDLTREALREGAYSFLKKPLDFDEIFRLIAQATGQGARILVADDDKDLCANMKEVLSDKGYRVNVAYDGNMAIEKSQKNSFDVIIIDMKLPLLNGLETYRAIHDFRPGVVAIVITDYPKEKDKLIQQALQEGAYTCLEKPINVDELVSLLEWIKQQKDKGTLKKPR